MRNMFRLIIIVVFAGIITPVATPVLADDSKPWLKITSPKDGAFMSSKEDIIIVYEMNPGPKGDHVHFYVDGGNAGLMRKNKGSFNMTKLGPGERELTVKLVNKIHVPIGVEASVKITVK